MCYYVDQKGSRRDVKIRFNIAVNNTGQYYEGAFVNGFDHPNIPIITNTDPDQVQTDFTWGLMPSWAVIEQLEFRTGKLNARIEDLDSKPSYRNIKSNRCLIIATGYYEWRWLDPKGKKKEKYQIFSQNDEIFCFAGLYDTWLNPSTGESFKTYTMVTTEANELMKYIHNNRERMPVMLRKEDEQAWLDPTNDVSRFAFPKYESKIIAFPTN